VAEPRLLQLSEDELTAAIESLGSAVAWPEPRLAAGGPDLATRVRARLVARPAAVGRPRPLRWVVVLAVALLVLLAAVATAAVLGVPGIRLIFGDPGGNPPPAVASPSIGAQTGAGLGLGDSVPVSQLEERAGFPVRIPGDPGLGPPDGSYVSDRDEVALVWAPTDALPPTIEPDVGLLLMQFRGSVSPEPIGKIISSGTTVEPVRLGDGPAYWISGDPHVYFYIDPDGRFIEEGRRWVGDALIWQQGELTYRIETSLGRDAAVRIAESLD